jgi:hypothetical protein
MVRAESRGDEGARFEVRIDFAARLGRSTLKLNLPEALD